MKKFLLSFCLIVLFNRGYAQEFDCKVTVDMAQMPTQFREVVQDFERNVSDYINSYRWTGDEWTTDKIECSMNITFISGDANGSYHANVFIGSQRAIYRSKKRSIEARIADDKWEFTCVRNQRFDHNDSRFDELTSFIDFYLYMMLGYDADSYEKRSGTKFFQKASRIASMAISGAAGWDENASGNYNRVQFVNELLSPTYIPLRDAYFNYHLNGLDYLVDKPNKAYTTMLAALESIAQLRTSLNARSNAIKIFFDTKYAEMAETFLPLNDPNVYSRLNSIDPSHQKTYDEYKDKVTR